MPDSRSDLALEAALRLMAPLIKHMLHEGVTYPRFTSALKSGFLEAAEQILQANATKTNDSSLSVLSGVHRKDARAWRAVGETLPQAKTMSPAMEVFARWASDPAYCNKSGAPKTLARYGAKSSFELLAKSVSNDVHPHTILKELIRLGLVQPAEGSDGAKLTLCADAFVPKEGSAEMLQLVSDNVGDHIAAAVHNLEGTGAPMLEQAIFADELSPESADTLAKLSRTIWSKALHELAHEATRLGNQDQGQPGADRRVRLGMYFYQDSSENSKSNSQ